MMNLTVQGLILPIILLLQLIGHFLQQQGQRFANFFIQTSSVLAQAPKRIHGA
jgi:hypothetical protein